MARLQKAKLDLDKVKLYADSKEISMSELGRQMGFNRSYFADLKIANRPIQLTYVKLLAMILGVTEDDIIYNEKPKKVDKDSNDNLDSESLLKLELIDARLTQIEEVLTNMAKALQELGSAENLANAIAEKRKPKTLVDAEQMLERMFNSTGKRECEYGAFIYNCKTKFDNPPIEMLHKAIYNKGCIIETVGTGVSAKRVIREGNENH